MRNTNIIEIVVYGAEQICQSCVNLPSSRDTFEWLEAAIARKFPNQIYSLVYVDIINPPQTVSIREFAQKVIQEEMVYPVVVINGKVVGEGNPHLKTIFLELQKYGFK